MIKIFSLLVFICFWYTPRALAQDTLLMTLDDLLELAIGQAVDLKIARSEAVEQDYALQGAQLAFQPQLFLNATLPRLNRSIESRQLPDGTDAFVNRSTMSNRVGFSFNYPVEKWGGTLSFNSDFERLDVLKTKEFDSRSTYFVSPIHILYSQPLFSFNELRWQKERLSLLHEEFKERYARTREDIILEAIAKYRSVFLAQQNLQLGEEKIQETDTLLMIKSRLFDMGQTTREEMLRLQLDLQNNIDNRDRMYYDWEQAQVELLDFLGIDRSYHLRLKDPPIMDDLNIMVSKAKDLAVNNDYITSIFDRRAAEAASDIERAAKDKDIQLEIGASLGLNATDESLSSLFNPLLDREIFNVTLRMPITGHKRYDVRLKASQERQNQDNLRREQEKLALSREIGELLAYFRLLQQSLATKEVSRQTADEILILTRRQFLLGKVSHTEISSSTREWEQALLSYYETLLDLIESYYRIRRLCMYDFINDKPLISDL